MSKRSNNPYYLDFNETKNAHQDRLGRQFQNYSCINANQEQINDGVQNKIFDYTQKYRSCREKDNPKSVLKVKAANAHETPYTTTGASNPHCRRPDSLCSTEDQGGSVPGQPRQPRGNPHSMWGINDSSRSSVANMSPEYLAMKQQQELTQLQQNSHNYQGLIDEVKMKQARERQMMLEASSDNRVTGNQVGGMPSAEIDQLTAPGAAEFTDVNRFGQKSTCLNAQGEWQDINPHNYVHNKKNKYEMLKKMSPEMLNQMYGKPPANQNVLPSQGETEGDVFDVTSWGYRMKAPAHLAQLKQQENQAYQRIMADRSQLKSYNQSRQHDDPNIPFCPIGGT
jgi:hypothetical protein